jgi:hypothetical protein
MIIKVRPAVWFCSAWACGIFALAAVPTVAVAQSQPSLAELARKEAERRKTVKDTKKVITAKDLPESARRPATAPASSGEASHDPTHGQKPAAGEKPADAAGAVPAASGAGDEAAWRNRMSQARETLRRNEVFLQALQTRVNALSNDFRNGGDFQQVAKVNAERQDALTEMERVKADVELSRKQVADIEEEARKAGVPPGWVR